MASKLRNLIGGRRGGNLHKEVTKKKGERERERERERELLRMYVYVCMYVWSSELTSTERGFSHLHVG